MHTQSVPDRVTQLPDPVADRPTDTGDVVASAMAKMGECGGRLQQEPKSHQLGIRWVMPAGNFRCQDILAA